MGRWSVVEGSYTGTGDDVAGTWYVVDSEGDVLDKRGRGWATRAEALAGLADTRPEIVMGTAEIADWLGVSQATVHQWRRRHPDFPAPMQTLATGPIWRICDVATWASRERPTGRPRKS